MPQNKSSPTTKALDLGGATARCLQIFQSGLDEKQYLSEKIRRFSAISCPTIRDLLSLAWLRNFLAFLEPPLPPGTAQTAAEVWRYWVEHPQEFEHYRSLNAEIENYLFSPEEIKASSYQTKLEMFSMIDSDHITYVALFPAIEELHREKPGRPMTRGQVAVRALQLKRAANLSWMQITTIVCDCGQANHSSHCKDSIRLSVGALTNLLRSCGVVSA